MLYSSQTMLYSPSTKGFYHPYFHKIIPDDAIEITSQHAEELLAAQSAGHEISVDENNQVISKPRELSPDEINAARINELRRNLANSDFKTLPDYQSRSGKSDDEIAQIYKDRADWYQELQKLLNKE